MATVLIPPAMRTLSDGEARLEAQGATLRQVIRDLGERYPQLTSRLVEDGRIGRGLTIAINGNVVSTGLIEPVPDGAEIVILPAISGG